MNLPPQKSGFVLLIAVIISTILFSIGIGLSTVIFKELILAFTARESQRAFYAADTGIECIRYWDNWRQDVRFDEVNPFNPPVNQDIECGDVITRPMPVGQTPKDFWLDSFEEPGTKYCLHGEVDKSEDRLSIVNAWGFNSCDSDYLRRVDRAFEARYESL